MSACKNELQKLLSETPKSLTVVVMPDFFADRLISLNYNPEEFVSALNSVVQRKGGSIDQIDQTDQRGGNALNVASALLALGVKAVPIVCTSKLGLEHIRFHLRDYNVDLSHVKTYSKTSVTTALEFQSSSGRTNVMLRDLGSLADFGPADLTEQDYRLIEDADYVCLFNWAGTLRHGTSLAEAVFQRAKSKGKCRTYLDTADPLPNEEGIRDLIERVLKSNQVDVLSVNENEAITFASRLTSEVSRQRKKVEFTELVLLSAQVLAKLHARIDLHTTTFSVSVTTEGAVFVPAFKIKPLRATGAGDAWDAGNIIGDACGLSAECRLTLASAVSACYLSDPQGEHPTRKKLARFLRKAESVGA